MNIYSKVMNGEDIEKIRKREDYEKKQITDRILNILTNTPHELTRTEA